MADKDNTGTPGTWTDAAAGRLWGAIVGAIAAESHAADCKKRR